LFASQKPVIGMIHLAALPGTAVSTNNVETIAARALAEAGILSGAGVHGMMIENMHDTPYLRAAAGPEIVAAMAVIAHAVKAQTKMPCGVQVLAAANREALAVAHAAGLEFIRVEGFAFAHVADEGIIEASAGELLRYRRHIGAERVEIWADIKKKHSAHAITADIGLAQMAEAVEFMRGDAVIVTGAVTGDAPRMADVQDAKKNCRLPVYVGSGVTRENLESFYHAADGFIIGAHFKRNGVWSEELDTKRIDEFMAAYSRLRGLRPV
jgi:membrane complex biogenesis BtpA family protein